MEINDLNTAKEEHKSFWDQDKEYLHCAAAFVHALYEIMEHKDKHKSK